MSVKKPISRRTFLAYLGTGAAAIVATSTGLGVLPGKALAADPLFSFQTNKISDAFQPIEPSDSDELVLPKGFKAYVLAAYGDKINSKGDTFGYNNGYTCFFPIEGSSVNGLLFVGHASIHSVLMHGKKPQGQPSAEQVKAALVNQGASVIEVYRDQEGVWKMNTDSVYARRMTGYDPIELTGPAKGSKAVHGASRVQGLLAGGSGTRTLWNTVLSFEGDHTEASRDAGLPSEQYGWAVEVDPFDAKSGLRKHTALGRFKHGSAAMTLSKDGRVVVYMGGTSQHGCIYKFVSKGTYAASAGKRNADLLTDGALYAANLETGEWVELTIDAVQNKLKDSDFQIPSPLKKIKEVLTGMFKEQADVLTHAHEAAILLGATPTDRPAGLALHPADHSLYIAHTSHSRHGNIHGHLTRLEEAKGDAAAAAFEFDTVSYGGRQSGYSAPGAINFDSNGNLWLSSDIQADKLNQGSVASFKNNGLYLLQTSGSKSGPAMQFASAPMEARLTGASFVPDERTLFLSVQNPGDGTADSAQPTSHWPHRSNGKPLPAVVAISGFNY
ncbi:PhoX family protein [Paenibacillus sp. NPDC056579]|uniref:PhoX family protein n=1 Tax=Paenibacillus sp. NPDC056579 TaxID=3345871 RepID=UPI003687B7DF